MIIKAAPLTRLPRNLGVFDYKSPIEIEPGQLVMVPLRNRKLLGVVIEKSNQPETEKIKEIDSIVTPHPIFNKSTLEFAQWISKYYATSLGIVLNSFIPIKTMKFLNNIPKINSKEYSYQKPKLIQTQEKFRLYKEIIEKSQGQVLIIVPELNLIGQWQKSLDLPYTVYTSELKGTKLQKAWTDIYTETSRVIIGTRFAIFAPVNNLETIIVDEEHNPFHKQEEPNPRFHIREAAEKLAQIKSAKIYFNSYLPSVEAWGKVENEQWDLEKFGNLSYSKVKVIDSKTGWPITPELNRKIIETLEKKQRVFLFINRLGSARIFICSDCGHEFKCETCNIGLKFHETNNQLACHSCGKKESIPLSCPKCQGVAINPKGIGTESLEKTIKEMHPAHGVLRIDSSVTEYHSNDDIIIGTQFALSILPYSTIGLIGIINFEQILSGTDYRSHEQAFSLIRRFQQYGADVYIQAFNPEHKLLSAIELPDGDFVEKELKERKIFNWPPYSTIVQVIIQDRDKNEAMKKARKIIKGLKDYEVNSPLPLYPPFARGRHRIGFLIKVANDFDVNLFAKIPNDCIIDVNPIKLN